MKSKKLVILAVFVIIAMIFSFIGCDGNGPGTEESCTGCKDINCPDCLNEPVALTGISLERDTLTLTLFAKEQLNVIIEPADADNKNVTWSSSAPAVVSVTPQGVVSARSFTQGGTSTVLADARGSAVITVTSQDGGFQDTITVNTTMVGQVDMMTLPPMKDQFADFFMIGNIARTNDTSNTTTGPIVNPRLIRHFNVLTSENDQKPNAVTNNRNAATGVITYNWVNSDRFVNSAENSGFEIIGHTLLWHSQIPRWQQDLRGATTMTAQQVTEIMRTFITAVASRYAGRIHTWDVLNEIFRDGVSANANWRTNTAMRDSATEGNPWFMRIGADFVYEGFKATRLADPHAILYYNDFNLNEVNKSTAVHNMVRDVNLQWESDPNYLLPINLDKDGNPRKLIEGIGMQSHHNTGITVAAIRTSLDRFRPLGVRISISELDVLSQTWGQYSPDRLAPTNNGRLLAANLYGEYFKLFLENADIIERVTFWGVFDGQSWRSTAMPLIFEGGVTTNPSSTSRAKPAYYRIMEELEAFIASREL
jgi:endo-1,4-beta-xylanase